MQDLIKKFNLVQGTYGGLPFMVSADDADRVKNRFNLKIAKHKYLGDLNITEPIGLDEELYEVKMFITVPDPWADNEETLRNQTYLMKTTLLQPFEQILQIPDLPQFFAIPDGSTMELIQYRGYSTITVTFTNALTNLQQQSIADQSPSGFLNPVNQDNQTFLQRSLAFANNTQAKIVAFQGNVSTFTDKVNAIAAYPTAITNTVVNLTLTANQLTGSLANVTSSISAMESTLGNIPNNISAFYTDLQNVFTSFINLFTDPATQINGLLSISNSNDGVAPLNNNSQTAQNINSNATNLNCALKVLCLANIYNIIPQIQFITKTSISSLLSYTNSLYLYIINNGSGLNFTNFNSMRNAFLIYINTLYQNANPIVTVDVLHPTDLHTLVYQYNGNFDYYNEIALLNNLNNTYAVQGEIEIILN